MSKLDSTNARAFNNSLKKAVLALTGKNVRVNIVNSYKFPDCYVQVILSDHSQRLSNEFRLQAFDTLERDRSSLINPNDVHYGNITSLYVTLRVNQWEKLFNSIVDEKVQ